MERNIWTKNFYLWVSKADFEKLPGLMNAMETKAKLKTLHKYKADLNQMMINQIRLINNTVEKSVQKWNTSLFSFQQKR